jgi:hypothetical protein
LSELLLLRCEIPSRRPKLAGRQDARSLWKLDDPPGPGLARRLVSLWTVAGLRANANPKKTGPAQAGPFFCQLIAGRLNLNCAGSDSRCLLSVQYAPPYAALSLRSGLRSKRASGTQFCVLRKSKNLPESLTSSKERLKTRTSKKIRNFTPKNPKNIVTKSVGK